MKILINPTEDPNIINDRVMPALGFLPPWFAEAFDHHPERVVDHVMNTCYQMGGGPQSDFTMDPNGTMHYPEDPPMVPIALFEPEPEQKAKALEEGWVYKIYQYDYGYVNYVSKCTDSGEDKTHMTRMD